MKKIFSKTRQKEIALERIAVLFQQADEQFSINPELSHRYVELARKIQMKAKVRITVELKRKFCKHCYKYLRTGVNARIRTREGKLIIYCLSCKKHTRIPLKKKQVSTTKDKKPQPQQSI
ncbi:MAG: ribonuclease P protein component 4 [Candidatus Woesearchaeota archaeon]